MQHVRSILAIALTLAALGPHAARGAEVATQATSGAVLSPSLPLRRDVAREGEQGGWALPLLAVTLASAGGAWTWWLRSRRSGAGSREVAKGGRLVRLSSQALTGHASVHAVRWNGEELLLACTGQQVRVIARRAVPGAAEDAA